MDQQRLDPAEQENLEALLDAYELAVSKGQAFDPERACAGSPRLLSLLMEQIQALRGFSKLAEALDASRESAEETQHTPPGKMSLQPPSRRIGHYKLLQLIGEGGQAEVWMAEQQQPVRRKVAVKLIFGRVNTKQVLARFAAERQALAMMDHPNIARMFDAGETPEGRPYFVMELVRGTPITRYCREHSCSPRDRLVLFTQVCQAVQHAHRKGIIHRDIKPSNVLVANYDGMALPKVIDFGMAKAIDTRTQLTDHTLFTEFGHLMGTYGYMSPEQAQPSQLDIDTRSDVYSLGALLYELLTGVAPIDMHAIGKRGLEFVLRIIREEDPPTPSVRVSQLSRSGGESEACVGIPPGDYHRILKGDLDWIVMRALQKSRERRYESALALARDIHAFLNHDPVEARPPSSWYTLQKAYQKRRRLWLTAGTGIASLLLTSVVSTGFAFQTSQAKNLALTQKAIAESRFDVALAAIEQFHSQVAENLTLGTPDNHRLRRQLFDSAMSSYATLGLESVSREALTDPQRLAIAKGLLAISEIASPHQDDQEGIQAAQQALECLEAMTQADGWQARMLRGRAYNNLGIGYHFLGQHEKARARINQALETLRMLHQEQPQESEIAFLLGKAIKNRIGLLHTTELSRQAGARQEVESLTQQCVHLGESLLRREPDNEHYLHDLGATHFNYAAFLAASGRFAQAVTQIELANDKLRQANSRAPGISLYSSSFAASLELQGQILRAMDRPYEEVEPWFEQAMLHWRKTYRQWPGSKAFAQQYAHALQNLFTYRMSSSSRNAGWLRGQLQLLEEHAWLVTSRDRMGSSTLTGDALAVAMGYLQLFDGLLDTQAKDGSEPFDSELFTEVLGSIQRQSSMVIEPFKQLLQGLRPSTVSQGAAGQPSGLWQEILSRLNQSR